MPAADVASRTASALLDELFRRVPVRNFMVRLWDGRTWPEPAPPQPSFTLSIHRPEVLRQLLLARDEAGLGEGYVAGDFDLDGDLEAVVPVAEALLAGMPPWPARLRLAASALRLPHDRVHAGSRKDGDGGAPDAGRRETPGADGGATLAAGRGRRAGGGNGQAPPSTRAVLPWRRSAAGRLHSRRRDRSAVTYHYDASNRFYELFLDPRMVYSCAYFTSPDDTLEAAQQRKLDYICRKLRLQPGERLLDIGCGWGALIIHAARHYGVTADGITLSENQAALARERIAAAGLADRCSVRIMDYRDVDAGPVYDKVASVGMFEHVGVAAMDAYFGQVFGLLRPGGAFLNHAIGGAIGEETHGQSFSDRWVFPDHELLPISVALRGAESRGFDVRDVENLREHYALTLRHWVRRLEQNRDEAVAAAGEARWRAWRLVFATSAHQFDAGRMHLYQTLLVKPAAGGRAHLPWTRADLYADGQGAGSTPGRARRGR